MNEFEYLVDMLAQRILSDIEMHNGYCRKCGYVVCACSSASLPVDRMVTFAEAVELAKRASWEGTSATYTVVAVTAEPYVDNPLFDAASRIFMLMDWNESYHTALTIYPMASVDRYYVEGSSWVHLFKAGERMMAS